MRPRPVTDPPRRIYREFESTCAQVRQSPQAPMAGLGPATQYLFYGSTSSRLAAPGTLPSGSTSCLNAGDRSTYWVPVLYQGSTAIRPIDFTVLYKSEVDDYTSVQAFPPGLRMIVGGPAGVATTPAQDAVSWSCQGYDGTQLPSSCPAGQNLTLRLAAPGCWDGRHLDVAGHRDHLAWTLDGRCPADHPVAIPSLLVRIIYPLSGSGALRSSSGPGGQFGFGFVSGWTPAALAKLIRNCINAGQQCDATGHF